MAQDLNAALLVLYGTLGGALIGMLSGLVSAYLATRAETRRHLLRMAFELGVKEWETHMVEMRALPGERKLMSPPFHYVHFNLRLLEALHRGDLSPAKWSSIAGERDRFGHAIEKDTLKPPTQPRQ